MNDWNRRDSVLIAVLVALGVLVLLPTLLMAVMMSGGMMLGGMMGGWRWDGGPGNYWWGWLASLLFWVLLIGGIVGFTAWAIRRLGPSTGSGAARLDEALGILKQRYARGEISKEQFEQMQHDISA